MAKLPSSFRERNRTTRSFRQQYDRLPDIFKEAVKEAAVLFDRDPSHHSLRHHELKDTKKGQHCAGSFSVSPTMQYRAIYVSNGQGVNIWYWLGTHAEYKIFTGGKN
jgi:hypothetical protein